MTGSVARGRVVRGRRGHSSRFGRSQLTVSLIKGGIVRGRQGTLSKAGSFVTDGVPSSKAGSFVPDGSHHSQASPGPRQGVAKLYTK